MCTIHLAVPPNIARALTHDLSRLYPEATFRPPMTHDEMDHFFCNRFGEPHETAHLTLTAYPEGIRRALKPDYRNCFAPIPDSLPPMRQELVQAGLKEESDIYKVVCVVPMMILTGKEMAEKISGWKDLAEEPFPGRMVIPPANTPAPDLFRLYMESLCGEKGRMAADTVQASLLPQDINKSIDEGNHLAGMVFPAFGRTSRNGTTQAIWPQEGAVAIPLVALLRADAPPMATQILDVIFSNLIQTRLAEEGLFLAIRDDVPLIDEMVENHNHLAWCGWENHIGSHA